MLMGRERKIEATRRDEGMNDQPAINWSWHQGPLPHLQSGSNNKSR